MHDHLTQLIVLDWLRDIIVEPNSSRIVDLIRHGISRQRHNWDPGKAVLRLPLPDLTTCVVSILYWHLNVAL